MGIANCRISSEEKNVANISKKLKEGFGFVAEHATVPHIAGLGGVARALLSNWFQALSFVSTILNAKGLKSRPIKCLAR